MAKINNFSYIFILKKKKTLFQKRKSIYQNVKTELYIIYIIKYFRCVKYYADCSSAI